MKDATCKTCPWWAPIGTAMPGHTQSFGVCNRFPPQGKPAEHPVTDYDDWCGEHPERKPQ